MVITQVATTAISNKGANTATSGGTISNNCGGVVTASGVCWSTSTTPIKNTYKIEG